MKISIITVVYNGEKYIESAIKSVLSQSYDAMEYVVVDGNSTDNTPNIIAKYADKIDRLICEPDEGIYDAMNKGIKAATGDVIGILNADDFYKDNHVISKVVHCFKNGTMDTLYGDLVYVDADNIERQVRYWKSGSYKRDRFKYGWMPPHPTFFVKRHIYDNYGLFDLRLRTAADYEYMLRILFLNRISTHYLPEVMTIMRTGGSSNASLRQRLRANSEDMMAWKINGLKSGGFARLLKPVRKLVQYFQSFK